MSTRMKGDSPDKGGPSVRGTTGAQTTACVVCGEESSRYTGHVVRAGKTVIAGWCNNHEPARYLLRGTGCFAHRCEVTRCGNLRPIEREAKSEASSGEGA